MLKGTWGSQPFRSLSSSTQVCVLLRHVPSHCAAPSTLCSAITEPGQRHFFQLRPSPTAIRLHLSIDLEDTLWCSENTCAFLSSELTFTIKPTFQLGDLGKHVSFIQPPELHAVVENAVGKARLPGVQAQPCHSPAR